MLTRTGDFMSSDSPLSHRFSLRPGLGTGASGIWADGALVHLVEGTESFDDNFGTTICVRRDSNELISLGSIDWIEEVILNYGLRLPDVRMMANGEPIDERKFTTSAQLGRQEVVGILDPVAVMKLIQDGATLILQGCRRYGRNIDSFCRQLDQELGQVTQAGYFLTPAQSQGAPFHYDFYDAFICQLEGSKVWQLSDSPSTRPRKPWVHGQTPDQEAKVSYIETFPGDCLYLPRGTYHSGRSSDGPSLHVTIRIVQPYTFRTVLETALDTMFPTLDLDLPLPIEYSKHAPRVAALHESSIAIGAVDLKSIVGDSIDLITKDFELETRSAEVGPGCLRNGAT